ncbi:hypothetical protein [Thiothrix unzii]|uniref:hypothetical protein n=1 Tax=Thiothrix unzii TaxID=111769 RepID=UPI002A35E257|nr:hypothetical protein [Thiothrix unzii]MDX9988533.1 hypothetical protein [Thiothrix unzii]
MMKNELEYLLQTDLIDTVENKWGNETWTIVDKRFHEENTYGCFSCAFIPWDEIHVSLGKYSFDFYTEQSKPDYWVSKKDGEEYIEYEYFMDFDSVKPLIIHRDFFDIKPARIEVLEEFRLFHNLYYDDKSNKYIKIIEGGEEIDAIIINDGEIKVKTKLIIEFISIKNTCFVMCCDNGRYSHESISNYSSDQCDFEVKADNLIYARYIRDDVYSSHGYIAFSRLLAKKVIYPVSVKKAISFFIKKEKNYQDFIIGESTTGEVIKHTCNPDLLANFFGANNDAPHYLTPVFFRRDVLSRYYSEPEKYTIEDGNLVCGSLWSMYIDNNHEKYVIVYLGDLGKFLSESEQSYWKSFNISPDGKMSNTNYDRSIRAQFSSPLQADLIFKQNFEKFNTDWKLKFNWHLFKPLSDGDSYLFTHLRIPVNESQAEFDYQVLTLIKILIDSLNEEAMNSYIVLSEGEKIRGIKKFDAFLRVQEISDDQVSNVIGFFRNLQELRSSSVGHRKSKNYQKISKVFGIDVKPRSSVFTTILNEANQCLSCLEHILRE